MTFGKEMAYNESKCTPRRQLQVSDNNSKINSRQILIKDQKNILTNGFGNTCDEA